MKGAGINESKTTDTRNHPLFPQKRQIERDAVSMSHPNLGNPSVSHFFFLLFVTNFLGDGGEPKARSCCDTLL